MNSAKNHQPVTRIAIVAAATAFHDDLRAMIQGMDWVAVDLERMDYEQALADMALSCPDGVIVNLDDRPPEVIQFIARVVTQCPRCSPIVVSRRPELLVEAFRRGAKALLDYPVQLEALSVVLKNLSAGMSLNRIRKTTTTAILSSRGGVGCTSLAVNLGCTLASEIGQPTVLLDLDLPLGTADLALHLQSAARLHDLIAQLPRMDLQLLKSTLIRDPSDLAVIARPALLADSCGIMPEHLDKLFTLLRILFSHLIVDVGKGWTANDLRVLGIADVILLVAQLEVSSISNAVLILQSLEHEGLRDKVRVVINRIGADFGRESLSLDNAENSLQCPIAGQLPNDYRTMSDALSNGQPLLRSAPKSKLQQRIAELAWDLNRPAAPMLNPKGRLAVPAK